MVRIARMGGGLSGLVDSDSDSDLGGLEATLSRSTSAAKRPHSRASSAASNHKTSRSVSTGGARLGHQTRQASPGKRVLSERHYTNDAPKARATTEKTWADEEDAEEEDYASDDLGWDAAPAPAKRARTGSVLRDDLQYSKPAKKRVAAQEISDSDEDRAPVARATGKQATRQISVDKTAESNSGLKRKFDNLTKEYDALQARYDELKDIGIKAAERNYDRLKKQVEDSNATSSKLIAALEDEVRDQTRAARESETLRNKLQEAETQSASHVTKISNLTSSLNESQREIQALRAKLTASRNAEAAAKDAAAKASAKAAAAAPTSSKSAAPSSQSELMHLANAKEDLYSTLTSLIIRSVKDEGEELVFDCLQSGRNGTVHFTLEHEKDSSSKSFDDLQYTYRPHLQQDRDGELLEVLPERFFDDFAIKGSHIPKFYTKLYTALAEKKK